MSLIRTNIDNLNSISKSQNKNYILKGLSKKRIGFILSAPDVGKGYLCLSIAYELASDVPFLKLKGSPGYFKTLYWPIEDGVDEVAKRMLGHMQSMPAEVVNRITENVMLWDSHHPLCTLRNGLEIEGSERARNELIKACQGVDLLIIDTLREAAGNADEVDDDQTVKRILQDIAIQADVAILVVHHLTKAAIRGNEKISNVSGSGFSTTQANSRMHLYLDRVEGKVRGDSKTTLSHIKANYISKNDRLLQHKLQWNEDSLLFDALNTDLYAVSNQVKSIEPSLSNVEQLPDVPSLQAILANKQEIVEDEPKEITLSSLIFSQSSIDKKALQQKQDEIVTEEDKEQLRLWHERKKRDQK
ncbi:AAA family ATPase [Rheinheimera sp. UJ51]|uniref:AAA family ATPase n=1 Tax=unclassified Rheinheimera TaxID=115860 RepID=UPI001E3AEA0C|nr:MULTISPECIES: AAA family ATPase [unclassified Rheinheimera]MCC5452875.1 AAA family ATPase [Rheinheimera sp. UJ51]MCF4010620.1 AAA family ATPase [Rheinheimera sp. UJ63]